MSATSDPASDLNVRPTRAFSSSAAALAALRRACREVLRTGVAGHGAAGPAARPTIDLVEGELARVVGRMVDALKADNAGVYDRGGRLFRVVRLPEPERDDGIKRPAGALALVPVVQVRVRLRQSRAASFRRYDARAGACLDEVPPAKLAGPIAAVQALADLGDRLAGRGAMDAA